MHLINRMCAKAYLFAQNAKEKLAERAMQTRLALASQKGGIENYITIIVIIAIVLVIGWAIWNFLFRGRNVIGDWFRTNVENIIDCTQDTINSTSGGSGTNPC